MSAVKGLGIVTGRDFEAAVRAAFKGVLGNKSDPLTLEQRTDLAARIADLYKRVSANEGTPLLASAADSDDSSSSGESTPPIESRVLFHGVARPTTLLPRMHSPSWVVPLQVPTVGSHTPNEVDLFMVQVFALCIDLWVNKSGAEMLCAAFGAIQSSANTFGGERPRLHLDTLRPFLESFKVVHQYYIGTPSDRPSLMQVFEDRYKLVKGELEGRIREIPQPNLDRTRAKSNDETRAEMANKMEFDRLNTQLTALEQFWQWAQYRLNESLTKLREFDSHFADVPPTGYLGFLPNFVQKLVITPQGTDNFPPYRRIEAAPAAASEAPTSAATA